MQKTFLIFTPPFTQLNTPYPATAYIKGFFNTKNISCYQADYGIEVTLKLFSKTGLQEVFKLAESKDTQSFSKNCQRILHLKDSYINTIDAAILFLQGKSATLANRITKRTLLPEASRFSQLVDVQWAFGYMGLQDLAKHICTLYLEDLSDFIKETIDPHFGFSRYAERLARSANKFDELAAELANPLSLIDQYFIESLERDIHIHQPKIIGISTPFPGNVFSAFRAAQFIKQKYPEIKITWGGGFPNTELRSISETRVFDYFDFITLDDGEAPLEQLVRYIDGSIPEAMLKRTFIRKNNVVTYINNSSCRDYKQTEVGTPDYSDLHLDKYISAIEVANPMHKLWSDGRWNKLTMAHGCYWGKCTFCDISLDYIKIYEPLTAKVLCDRIETMIEQTGETGFHFVDEAAPPSLMRELALEIIRRGLNISWWTNVRFEKSFNRDLCILLKASGCIAVSGGLEVASDRLLKLINKGITVEQVARVNKNFTDAGIMVHAYLMYGFPTQTAQETIDSLEMVRQMFKLNILQSAFWHQFAMTAHSPVGLNPEAFGVKSIIPFEPTFANNDVVHEDPTGAQHEYFSEGLKKSLFNYMNGIGIDEPLHKWFDFKIPKTTVTPDHIQNALEATQFQSYKDTQKVIFIGNKPSLETIVKTKKGVSWESGVLMFETMSKSVSISISGPQAEWLKNYVNEIKLEAGTDIKSFKDLKSSYDANQFEEDFDLFWDNKATKNLYQTGLLIL